MPVKLGGMTSRRSKTIRTKSWSEAAGIIENILGSRYMLGAQVGDSITIKYVKEDWNGQPQHQLTRDGRFTLAPDGRLVMSNGNHPVLDVNDQPILLDPALPKFERMPPA